jgi:membrane fusion protein (multidrug efflux system)
MRPVVPQAAVLVSREGRYVLAVDAENRVSSRPILIGQTLDALWVVESGLAAGDRIVVQGIQKATPGQTVQVKPEPAGGK